MRKIYTKSGDEGMTSLLGGKRVMKNDVRIEANGELDELNSLIGVARSMMNEDDACRGELEDIQRALMAVMSHVASSGENTDALKNIQMLTAEMEKHIDDCMANGNFGFVLPGSNQLSAFLHLARSKARTTERRLWTVNQQYPLNADAMKFINRLSDYLFALAIEKG